MFFGLFVDDESTYQESYASSVPSKVMVQEPASIASSCSSSTSCSSVSESSDDDENSLFTEQSSVAFSTSHSGYFGEDEVTLTDAASLVENQNVEEPISIRTSSSSCSTAAKLTLQLDSVRRLARLGQNATVKNKCRLPASISKQDIHVLVDFDERARFSYSRQIEHTVQEAIRDDLRAVYSANAQSAKLFLCVVVIVLADGSIMRTLIDQDGVNGLAEIGLVWRLFEADNLTVYDGGMVVQTERVASTLFDFLSLTNRGRKCLLQRLVPRVANDIVSRIADSNEDLLVEI